MKVIEIQVEGAASRILNFLISDSLGDALDGILQIVED
jgi:hypothetical protein